MSEDCLPMSYEITITEKRDVVKTCGKEWKVIGQTQKKSEYDTEPYMSDVYDYTPEIEKNVSETREILKQTVEDLDLAAVIKAINKL